jgi:transposase-like protein
MQSSLLGKRKRKSERDLSYLRAELKKEFLWSREKIEEVAQRLNMNETQVYKWWWDQTRKRQKLMSNQGASKKISIDCA